MRGRALFPARLATASSPTTARRPSTSWTQWCWARSPRHLAWIVDLGRVRGVRLNRRPVAVARPAAGRHPPPQPHRRTDAACPGPGLRSERPGLRRLTRPTTSISQPARRGCSNGYPCRPTKSHACFHAPAALRALGRRRKPTGRGCVLSCAGRVAVGVSSSCAGRRDYRAARSGYLVRHAVCAAVILVQTSRIVFGSPT